MPSSTIFQRFSETVLTRALDRVPDCRNARLPPAFPRTSPIAPCSQISEIDFVMFQRLLLIFIYLFCFPAAAVCVKATNVKLRNGPGSKFKVTWTVGRYMPLKIIGEQKGWYKVQDVDRETHWISKGLVTDEYPCVVVKSRSASLRTGPGREHPLAEFETVDKYTPFKKLGRDGDWIYLQAEDEDRYWTQDSNLWQPTTYVQVNF